MVRTEAFHQRVITADGRGDSRRASNPPDVPPVGSAEFKISSGDKIPSSWWDYRVDKGSTTQAIQVVRPLTSVFESYVGGRRVGGGGTSREALHRARRKFRLNRRPGS